jgi:hypothetical protein
MNTAKAAERITDAPPHVPLGLTRRREDASRAAAEAIDDIAEIVDGLSGVHEDLTKAAVGLEKFVGGLLAELRVHVLASHPAIAQAWAPIEIQLHAAARRHAEELIFVIAQVAMTAGEMEGRVKLLVRLQREGGAL